MKYITTYLSVVVVALFVSQAQSQYIEIRYEVTGIEHSRYRFGRSVLIFDTSVAPEIDHEGRCFYHAIRGQYYLESPSRDATIFKVLEEEVDVYNGAYLRYDPDDQSVFIVTDPVAGREMWLLITEISDSFHKDMESLPDSPEDYDMTEDYSLQICGAGFGSFTTGWSYEFQYGGGAMTYGARLVTELEPEACSPADINRDGIVDFFDVSEFIQIFLAGCP